MFSLNLLQNQKAHALDTYPNLKWTFFYSCVKFKKFSGIPIGGLKHTPPTFWRLGLRDLNHNDVKCTS
jgi:hypothetical protein